MQKFLSYLQCATLECGGCAAPPKTVCGIGAVLMPNPSGELEVVDLVPGGAAEQSGLLQIGDILHEVDGVDMYKLPAKEVGEFIRGEVGTTISLGVAKKRCASGTVYIETIQIVRSEARLPDRSTAAQATRAKALAWESKGSGVGSGGVGGGLPHTGSFRSHLSQSMMINNAGGNASVNLCDAAGIGAVLSKNALQDLEFTGGKRRSGERNTPLPLLAELMEGGPAESCGMIDIGDILTEVDGVNIEKKALAEVGNMIRGDAGTTVCLAIAKEGDREQMVFPVIIRDNTKMNENEKKPRVINFAAKAAKAVYVSFDPLDMTLCEPDLKHRPTICPVSTTTTTTVCVTLSPR